MTNDEEGTVVKKIYPLISDLDSVQNIVVCSVVGCGQTFKSQSNLTMHLMKHHKGQNLEPSDGTIKQFYCPNINCVYNNKLHFSKIKYLKQHYLKVHAEKKYICGKCSKGFSIESVLNKHSQICGILFKCCVCKNTYGTYEALTIHCRRKNHAVLAKSAFMPKSTVKENEQTVAKEKTSVLPNTINVFPIILNGDNEKNMVDQETQTDIKKRSSKRRTAQQTQTIVRKKSRKNVETQTFDDYLIESIMPENTKKYNSKEDSGVQTNFLPNELNLNFYNNLNILEDSCNSQTQTDLFRDDYLPSTVFISHTETQTTTDQLDLYSNMYTQTCDDVLLSELEFTNIQTQTNWPDYDSVVSTETQTSNLRNDFDLTRAISHMETQTDLKFKQLLEEMDAVCK